jgi:hypothetical protein
MRHHPQSLLRSQSPHHRWLQRWLSLLLLLLPHRLKDRRVETQTIITGLMGRTAAISLLTGPLQRFILHQEVDLHLGTSLEVRNEYPSGEMEDPHADLDLTERSMSFFFCMCYFC